MENCLRICKKIDADEFDGLSETEKNEVEKRLQLFLNEGWTIPADSESRTVTLPDYFDEKKFHIGQEAFNKNIFTMMIAKLSGLLLLLAVPSILNILKFTKQSGTPCAAFKRYAATILHTCIWYRSEPNKNLEFFKSLNDVRRKHCIASKRSFDCGIGRISQMDMALTQFGFMGFSLLCGDTLGIVMTEKEADGLLHFWRVIGHMLGTEERFNLCNGSVEQTKALCRRLLQQVFIPNLSKNTEDFQEMSLALLKGLWPINPFIDVHAYKAITYHLVSTSLPKNNNNNNNNNNDQLNIDEKQMPIWSRFIVNLQLNVHKYLFHGPSWWTAIFRSHFNLQMKLAIYLTEKFPFLAYWAFGKKESNFVIYKYHVE